MKNLPNVTLIGVDCLDLKRLQLATEISTKEISFGAVKLLSSIASDDPRVVKIPEINTIEKYCDFMIKDLYKYVDTEFALVFQYDGFVLNPSAWSDEFFKYDYIGSPWYHLGDLHVGNGGFSLRSRRLLGWLGENWQKIGKRIHPEDVFISKFARPYIEQVGMKFAPLEIAKQFSMEGNEETVVWNEEFGFHGATYTNISKWLTGHEEYKDKLNFKLDDYTELMSKYPIYDGTVHTFHFRKYDKESFKRLFKNEKNYEARLTKGQYHDFSNIKVGDTVVCKRTGISYKDLPIPAFEKRVVKIENFNNLQDLKRVHPTIHISVPIKDIPKWQQRLIGIFGSLIYPKEKPYSVFYF